MLHKTSHHFTTTSPRQQDPCHHPHHPLQVQLVVLAATSPGKFQSLKTLAFQYICVSTSVLFLCFEWLAGLVTQTQFISSVRSSYSHPDLLVTQHPLFQITPVLNKNLNFLSHLGMTWALLWQNLARHPDPDLLKVCASSWSRAPLVL